MEGDDSSDSNPEMAECGACRAVIPVDSTSCSACNVSFTGVAEDEMGECGSCGSLVSLDSKSCNQCGVHFVLDDLTTALSDWMKDEGLSITDLFSKVDTDGDDCLSSDEIRDALLDRKLAFLPHQDLDRFLAQIDLNDDGQISFAELAAALSMPWARPAEKIVLEPEPEEEEAEEEADDSEDDDSDEEDSDDDEDDGDSDDDEEDSDDEDESEDDDSDEEDSDDDEDDDDSEDEEEDDSEEDSDDGELSLIEQLSNLVRESDDNIKSSFNEFDVNNNGKISATEFGDTVEKYFSDIFNEEKIDELMDALDVDEDGNIDLIEFVDGVEYPEEVNDTIEENNESEGPAEWQRFLMQHFENIFPVFYLGVGIFILAFLLNAFGLFVDGSGGSVAFDGTTDAIYQDEDGAYVSVSPGDIYPCDQSIQESNCKNSLTPFAGENGSNSMPAGFYWDGIFFMILGLAGMGGIFYLQMQIKAMRSEHRRQKRDDENDSESDSDEDASDDDDEGSDDDSDDEGSDDDSDDEDSDDDSDDEGSDDDSDDEDSDDDSDDEDSDDDDSNDDDPSDDDDSDDEDDDDEGDGIEIGTRVGVEDEDGDWYGVVTEFDEDEDAVVVKRKDDDEEYVVDWDALFLDD